MDDKIDLTQAEYAPFLSAIEVRCTISFIDNTGTPTLYSHLPRLPTFCQSAVMFETMHCVKTVTDRRELDVLAHGFRSMAWHVKLCAVPHYYYFANRVSYLCFRGHPRSPPSLAPPSPLLCPPSPNTTPCRPPFLWRFRRALTSTAVRLQQRPT